MFAGTRPNDVFNLEVYNIHVVSIVQSAFAGQCGQQQCCIERPAAAHAAVTRLVPLMQPGA
jgi:hypothetical protein